MYTYVKKNTPTNTYIKITDIRNQLFKEICNISSHFPALIQDEQFIQIMSNPLYYRCASRAMYNILK